MAENPVQGYVFYSMDDDNRRNGTICKIIRRAEGSMAEVREFGPAFVVKFGDNATETVMHTELHPWYPYE